MKKTVFSYLYILISISGCSVDFNPAIEKSSECLVINSLLQPDSMISIRFYAIVIKDKGMEAIPLQGANALLRENQTVLYEGTTDSLLLLDICPLPGAVYSIEVTHSDYPTAKAETSIPYPVNCRVDCVEENLFLLSELSFPESKTPLWITASALFTDKAPLQYGELYCNNLLIDNFNREEGSDLINKKVGSGYHESFLRIKAENQARLNDILLLPMLNRSILWDNFTGDEIRLISASKEYDQYCKTFFQLLDIPISDDISAMLYQPVHVYSNIRGGLGIFAGKTETPYFLKASI